jgi:hypothetical protein
MPTKLITIGEILEMSPGDRQNAVWINDDFECVLSDPKKGQGKAPNTAVLTDPHSSGISILGNFFGTDPSRYAGKVVHISGKGISRTEYKGTQQVTIGDKATIQIVGDAKPGQAGKSPAASSGGGSAAPSREEGQRIGNAITNACANIRESMAGMAPEAVDAYYSGTAFSKDLWTQASDIIRVARLLESGKLADAPKVRNEDPQDKAKREAEEKAAAEKAEADRKAKEEQARKEANQSAPGAGNVDEDVPF